VNLPSIPFPGDETILPDPKELNSVKGRIDRLDSNKRNPGSTKEEPQPTKKVSLQKWSSPSVAKRKAAAQQSSTDLVDEGGSVNQNPSIKAGGPQVPASPQVVSRESPATGTSTLLEEMGSEKKLTFGAVLKMDRPSNPPAIPSPPVIFEKKVFR
jgi:hypothetical protein